MTVRITNERLQELLSRGFGVSGGATTAIHSQVQPTPAAPVRAEQTPPSRIAPWMKRRPVAGKARPRPRHESGTMNRTERAYAEVLERRKAAGEILSWQFEAVKFRLAKLTFYTPDFMVVTPDHIEFHEVKGFWEDDARVKIKVAAETYPAFIFRGVMLKKKQWTEEEF